MRRITSLLAIMVVMAALLVASAMPAFAAPNPSKANYIGTLASFGNAMGPGLGGMDVSVLAKNGEICQLASSNCTTGPN